ncbi:hypothetical protein PTSG_10628 [Salpingoeca rosetta]|uniref:Cyclic nucleotide-binding domain-containing protein n=1 Tax=Salpingoeca rosetta (strain ATCC 50818 / BSB-021) TaxID=946362 RepID=F2URW8_SALR5|nr:uncharacterized protein PTSG_10628 [Salpingoeca rosetta]EGD80373.1 hypothetical protein PTSG_10628 [Salpingoeca rosetta]|eukprot:XP_004988163.1 hypothetical protein PTSG_10628 [Salpingoeca rosetta]
MVLMAGVVQVAEGAVPTIEMKHNGDIGDNSADSDGAESDVVYGFGFGDGVDNDDDVNMGADDSSRRGSVSLAAAATAADKNTKPHQGGRSGASTPVYTNNSNMTASGGGGKQKPWVRLPPDVGVDVDLGSRPGTPEPSRRHGSGVGGINKAPYEYGFAGFDDIHLPVIRRSPEAHDTGSLVELPEDRVRNALEKQPSERTDDDVTALMQEMARLSAFAFLPHSAQRAFCQHLGFREYCEDGAVVVMGDDASGAWWVVLSGAVMVCQGEEAARHGLGRIVREGQAFGVDTGTPERGELVVTGTVNCQLITVTADVYSAAMAKGSLSTREITSNGQVVLVTEQRTRTLRGKDSGKGGAMGHGGSRARKDSSVDGGGDTSGDHDDEAKNVHARRVKYSVIIKGAPKHLVAVLFERNDRHGRHQEREYRDIFLLTYRTFVEATRLLNAVSMSLEDPRARSYAIAVITAWVEHYFIDFQTSAPLYQFLLDVEVKMHTLFHQDRHARDLVDGIATIRRVVETHEKHKHVIFQLPSSVDASLLQTAPLAHSSLSTTTPPHAHTASTDGKKKRGGKGKGGKGGGQGKGALKSTAQTAKTPPHKGGGTNTSSPSSSSSTSSSPSSSRRKGKVDAKHVRLWEEAFGLTLHEGMNVTNTILSECGGGHTPAVADARHGSNTTQGTRSLAVYVSAVASGSVGESLGVTVGDRVDVIEPEELSESLATCDDVVSSPTIADMTRVLLTHKSVRIAFKADIVALTINQSTFDPVNHQVVRVFKSDLSSRLVTVTRDTTARTLLRAVLHLWSIPTVDPSGGKWVLCRIVFQPEAPHGVYIHAISRAAVDLSALDDGRSRLYVINSRNLEYVQDVAARVVTKAMVVVGAV